MSAPIALVLGANSVRVVVKGSVSAERDVPWSPLLPENMVRTVRERAGTPSAVVIVVGLAFLEIAEPDLPPLSANDKRTLLWRDADRYFPVSEPVAVACMNQFALATPSSQLEQWVQAISAIGPVRAVIAAPQLCARFVVNGSVILDAGTQETGEVQLRDGQITEIRRTVATSPSTLTSPARRLDSSTLGREALYFVDAPSDVQLLDASLHVRMQRARRRRVLASVALAVSALAIFGWSANRWRDAVLESTESRVEQLRADAMPAQQADRRLRDARAELTMLADASRRAQSPEGPLAVLERLTRVLPRDAFVQKLEWDGQQWRADGTTDNAPKLIPVFDADTHFRDVRSAAPSQRFLEAGRQRETFAITFRIVTPAGGNND